ncbi:MAG: methyltransferase domain-containing protein, partial [Lachnospiraceae bacterium]|nr:methyltransferase domain-containing protein [Candidatus Equihabitans merdae]
EDNAFDVLITRNVTWNLPKPAQAYKEWLRVMAAGGILLNYDADWYGYLKDDEKQKAFQEDREQAKAMDLDDANVGENFDVCERLAEDLPLTGQKRPEWDLAVMREAGYASAEADPEIWKTVLREDEKIMWASTPMFLIQGRK